MKQILIHESFCLTYSGKFVDFMNMSNEDICLKDIAHSLSVKTRFNGASKIPYSIAQHCCLCALWADSDLDKRIALLHDAEEAYFQDIPGPLKLQSPWKEVDEIASKLREQIWTKYVPNWTKENSNYKKVDEKVLAVEIRTLVNNWEFTKYATRFVYEPIQVSPIWSWEESERSFLNFCQLLGIKD